MRRTIMGALLVFTIASVMVVAPAAPASAGGNDIDYLSYAGSSCVAGNEWIAFQTADRSGRARSLWLYVEGPDPAHPGSATWIFEGHTAGKGYLSVSTPNLPAQDWNYMAEAMMYALDSKGEPTKLLSSTTIYFNFDCP